MASIKDVAKLAEVSVTTVSRVMNNRGYIGKETRKKVEKAMKDLDYQPNQVARALQNKQTTLLGVIVPDASHPFFAQVVKHIEINATLAGYKVIICNSLDDHEKEENYINMLRANRIEGIIMCSQTHKVSHYDNVSLPIVSFDRILPNIPYVSSDNFQGGVIATQHLIDQGCKKLLHISGPQNLDMLSNRRGNGFSITCEENNIPHDIIESEMNLFGPYTYDNLYSFISKNVAPRLNDYDGVFCSDDLTAYILYLWATNNGLNVPEDLKIVGYDYHSFTQILQTPRLTTVKQSAEKIGNLLCSKLIELIKKKNNNDSIQNAVINVELIKGTTT